MVAPYEHLVLRHALAASSTERRGYRLAVAEEVFASIEGHPGPILMDRALA